MIQTCQDSSWLREDMEVEQQEKVVHLEIFLPQSYSGSQVLVSTGRVGTGYIRINPNPSDQATPYIDIVERTGTGLYDVELKGKTWRFEWSSFSRNVPLGFTGFGLMSEVSISIRFKY